MMITLASKRRLHRYGTMATAAATRCLPQLTAAKMGGSHVDSRVLRGRVAAAGARASNPRGCAGPRRSTRLTIRAMVPNPDPCTQTTGQL